MDIMDIATKMLADKIGKAGADNAALNGVLGKLIGSVDKLDLAGLVNGLKLHGDHHADCNRNNE